MMCGRVEIPDWDLIPETVQLVHERLIPRLMLARSKEDPNCLRECLPRMLQLRRYIQDDGKSLTLFSLLRQGHQFRATDPRDKIYAMLGLASDRERMALPIDYECRPEDLYIAVAKKIAVTRQGHELLYANLDKKNFSLPSRVPDWSS